MSIILGSIIDFFTQLAAGVSGQMVAGITAAIPKLTAALFTLLFGWWIASLLRKVLRRVLAAMQIDRLVDRLNEIEIVQRTGIKIQISNVLAQTLFYMLMLIFIVAATDVLGIEPVTKMVSDLLNYIPSLFSAAVIFLLGLFLADIIRGVALTAMQSLGIPSAKLIASIIFYFLFITIAVSSLAQARIETGFIASNLTVVIGAGALAFAFGYGLAARDLVSNYLASYYNRNKVQVGDKVRIGDSEGQVVMIDSTSMILQTHDRAIIVPLSKLTTEKVEVFYPEAQDDDLLQPGD
ncbi:MAG: mechanosensitive ion channel [Lewinellaceae bacterium]|nr:mechanosensitive ion channel [Lewinellaceae bacterium]